MKNPVKILLQPTIPYAEDDWHIGRFSLLTEHLKSLKDENGDALYEVTARNLEQDTNGNDKVLNKLDESDFDQLWLFALDTDGILSKEDCRGDHEISSKRQRNFHDARSSRYGNFALHGRRNRRGALFSLETKRSRTMSATNATIRRRKTLISRIIIPVQTAIIKKLSPSNPFTNFLKDRTARQSNFSPRIRTKAESVNRKMTIRRVLSPKAKVGCFGKDFNLIVAFERSEDKHGNKFGRGIAESSFHHLVDYNWDTKGCPTFLEEPPGDDVKNNPEKLEDIKTYISNLARWLASK